MKEEELDLIEKYVHGEMDRAEQEAFKQKLSDDDDFKKTYDDISTVIKGVKVKQRQVQLDQLKDLENSLSKGPSHGMPPFYWAAACLLLVIAGLIWIPGVLKQSTDDLFTTYYEPYPNLYESVVRGKNETTDLKKEVYSYYEAGAYDKALDGFEQLPSVDRSEEDIFYMGLSTLALGNGEKAAEILEQLFMDDSPLAEQISWYLALSHLKAEKLEESIILLNNETVQNSKYASQAQELSNKIKQLR